jgi:hypothetical protein
VFSGFHTKYRLSSKDQIGAFAGRYIDVARANTDSDKAMCRIPECRRDFGMYGYGRRTIRWRIGVFEIFTISSMRTASFGGSVPSFRKRRILA